VSMFGPQAAELARELFDQLAALRERLGDTIDALQYEEAKAEAFSVSVKAVADANGFAVVVAEPRAGELWEVRGIGVAAVDAAGAAHPGVNVALDLGSADRPLGQIGASQYTVTQPASGPYPEDRTPAAGGFWLPAGLVVRALTGPGTGGAAGDVLTLHVWGQRLLATE
jgi:hypothetical protein